MKFALTIIFFFCQFVSIAQSDDDDVKKFFDTLKMGGSYLIGKTMNPFELNSLQGNTVTNASLKNKITFINFWFEACTPCLAEMDALENLFVHFKEDKKFQFVSITFEKNKAIKKLSEKYKMTYPVFSTTIDSCHYLNYKKGFPTSIILNEKGEIAFFINGGSANPAEAEKYIVTNIYPVLNLMLNY